MSNTIQIKSGSGKPDDGVLKKAELGYDTTNGYLYIGNSSNQTVGIKVDYAASAANATNADSISGITASKTEINYLKGVTSAIQTQLNNISSAASTAQSTANTAQASANTAQGRADSAYQVGATAQASANTAQGRADSAYSLASTANSTANTANSTANAALPKAGGTITGVLKHEQNRYVHKLSNDGTAQYKKFASIKITGNYINQEIWFKMLRRGGIFSNIYICFNNGDTLTPSLNYIQTDNLDVSIHNEGNGVWALYAYANSWDSLEVIDFQTGKYASDKMTVTWSNTNASSLPSGAVSASTRPLSSRYYGDTLPSSAPAGAIFFKKV